MSGTASIDLEFSSAPDAMALLAALLAAQWVPHAGAQISYLPLHDEDNYDWRFAAIEEWPEVQALLAQKAAAGERLGLSLTHGDSDAGGELLMLGERLSMALSVNRVRLLECPEFTDFSWYLARLLPPLWAAGAPIRAIHCSDTP